MLLLFGAAFMILTSVSPHVFPRPNIDQGVYTYIAGEILEGKVPYRDLWDHKGPIIYYIYALGLLLDPVYGVWLLGIFNLFLAAFLSYRLLFNLFGRAEALFGTLAWLLELQFILDGGGTIEFFNLPLLFGSLYLVFLWLVSRSAFPAAPIGALGALAFLLRPNEMSVLLPACLLCLYRAFQEPAQARFWIVSLIRLALGFGAVAAAFALALVWQGALADFADMALRFNYLYTQTRDGKWQAVFVGAYFVAPLFIFSFAAWLAFLSGKYPKGDFPLQALIPFLTIALPAQVWLATLSNRLYPHYYISWLPLMSLMFVVGIRRLIAPLTAKETKPAVKKALLFALASLPLLFIAVRQRLAISAVLAALWTTGALPALDLQKNPDRVYTEYIAAHTVAEDTIWFWGNQVTLNVQSNRKSPSRLIYPYPLSVPGYATPQLVQETLRELRSNPPALIIDAPEENGMPSLEDMSWKQDRIVLPLIEYIHDNYRVTDRIGPNQWAVWKKK